MGFYLLFTDCGRIDQPLNTNMWKPFWGRIGLTLIYKSSVTEARISIPYRIDQFTKINPHIYIYLQFCNNLCFGKEEIT